MGKSVTDLPRKKIADFCSRNHIRRLSLFGSVLRGEYRPDSDMDLIVEFHPDHVPDLIRLVLSCRSSRLVLYSSKSLNLELDFQGKKEGYGTSDRSKAEQKGKGNVVVLVALWQNGTASGRTGSDDLGGSGRRNEQGDRCGFGDAASSGEQMADAFCSPGNRGPERRSSNRCAPAIRPENSVAYPGRSG